MPAGSTGGHFATNVLPDKGYVVFGVCISLAAYDFVLLLYLFAGRRYYVCIQSVGGIPNSFLKARQKALWEL